MRLSLFNRSLHHSYRCRYISDVAKLTNTAYTAGYGERDCFVRCRYVLKLIKKIFWNASCKAWIHAMFWVIYIMNRFYKILVCVLRLVFRTEQKCFGDWTCFRPQVRRLRLAIFKCPDHVDTFPYLSVKTDPVSETLPSVRNSRRW
jgi:hypothetical protein